MKTSSGIIPDSGWTGQLKTVHPRLNRCQCYKKSFIADDEAK
jgi:hypothetical protein